MDETPSTWGQSFAFIPINLATKPQVRLCGGPQNALPASPWKNPIPTTIISALWIHVLALSSAGRFLFLILFTFGSPHPSTKEEKLDKDISKLWLVWVHVFRIVPFTILFFISFSIL